MNISISGVERILERIKRLSDLDARCAEIAKRLCEIGEPIVKQVHGNHASVWSEPTKNGYKVVAEGEDVLFIEFGAGDAAGSENSLYDDVPSSARPGSWSIGHARMYSRYGFWVFAGQIIHEVQPTPAFYYAYEYMVQNLPKIAQEVFEK